MIDYSIFDIDTGRILRSGESVWSTLSQVPLAENEGILPGTYRSALHYVHRCKGLERPAMPSVQIFGAGFVFSSPPPAGTRAVIASDFINAEVEIDGLAVALAVPERATVEVISPWPYQDADIITLMPDPYTGPDDARIVAPDLDRMRAYCADAIEAQADTLIDTMLGNPTDSARRRWTLKRSVRDRFLAGTDTAEDRAAMDAAVGYSGATVQEELTTIGGKVAFEDWVTMRADSARQEALARLSGTASAAEILDVFAWAKAESITAIAEAKLKNQTS